MKNEHLIKQFMEENGIEFNKPFWVKSSNNEVKYKIIEKEYKDLYYIINP